MRNLRPIVLFGLGGLLLTTLAVAQQVKKTRTATITARSMELDWNANVVEFTGNCKLVVGGDYNATMVAPTMTVKLTQKGDKVKECLAKGPVTLTVITKPDSQGVKRKLVASAQQQASYSEETQVVKLTGGAQADLTPLNDTAGAEAVHFTGQVISANLKTSRLAVDDANLTVKSEITE